MTDAAALVGCTLGVPVVLTLRRAPAILVELFCSSFEVCFVGIAGDKSSVVAVLDSHRMKAFVSSL